MNRGMLKKQTPFIKLRGAQSVSQSFKRKEQSKVLVFQKMKSNESTKMKRAPF
jgi:hypothetical protein